MAIYTCPTCGATMERDLSLFMEHTDQHIIEAVKKRNPNWVTPDGYCPKCLDYFKKAMRNPGTLAAAEASSSTNIGPDGIRQRRLLGIFGLAIGVTGTWALRDRGSLNAWRLTLFIPFFFGALGFIQAQKKLCVVIAQTQGAAQRRRALRLVAVSTILATALTAAILWR